MFAARLPTAISRVDLSPEAIKIEEQKRRTYLLGSRRRRRRRRLAANGEGGETSPLALRRGVHSSESRDSLDSDEVLINTRRSIRTRRRRLPFFARDTGLSRVCFSREQRNFIRKTGEKKSRSSHKSLAVCFRPPRLGGVRRGLVPVCARSVALRHLRLARRPTRVSIWRFFFV